MDDVLILGEVKEGSLDLKTLELMGAGKKLAGELGGEFSLLLIGDSVSEMADEALPYGPSKVYKLEHPLLQGFKADLWVMSLEQACREINPKILLMSHSFMGMELGPRLACRLNTRLTTDCIDLSIDPGDGLLLRTKPVSGGNAISVFKCSGEPQLATVRGKVFAPAELGEANGEIVDIKAEIDESMIKVESLEIVREEIVALDKADVVVSGGAGLGEEDGFELLEELREALSKSFDNVMIGCSRVAVDKGWISSDHQVGLTGTMISPDIYVAVGISGAIQHLVGMVHAKKIIAINTDPGCNMLKVADYGVVEDYEEIIPALIEKLEELS
ncbi:MAG: electron transfer flavoprotein subunit alpha/FixB family protein [Deltaproteobacteria bacterium]|uniref:Electron transfer flavoprotein subunit alpha/FixB family protein n=1 Tax=Candidatus Desulfacyla euxinica TaxID=2841693 RepID=A0A8J6T7B0_9DELT|nr:electron transfer flavoprotein subunit alpha/FixB family protein [Candidatus Desulfacyla euxinica]